MSEAAIILDRFVSRLDDVADKLSSTATKLDSLAEQLGRAEQDREKIDDDHENRIRLLERFQWKVVGVATACGAFSGVVGALIVALASR